MTETTTYMAVNVAVCFLLSQAAPTHLAKLHSVITFYKKSIILQLLIALHCIRKGIGQESGFLLLYFYRFSNLFSLRRGHNSLAKLSPIVYYYNAHIGQ